MDLAIISSLQCLSLIICLDRVFSFLSVFVIEASGENRVIGFCIDIFSHSLAEGSAENPFDAASNTAVGIMDRTPAFDKPPTFMAPSLWFDSTLC